MKSRTNREQTDRNGEPASVDLALLASLFDLAPDTAYFVKDAQGRYVLVNESLLLRHGLERKEDAIGKVPATSAPVALDAFPPSRTNGSCEPAVR